MAVKDLIIYLTNESSSIIIIIQNEEIEILLFIDKIYQIIKSANI